jgi:hypothetical protein
MSKGEWTGWKKWNDFKNAGIVENAVDFSDEAIITDHAVGRTKDAIDMCWPMDAAVAYTLMKVGPDVELSKVDMVNTFTRSAAVMMTGKVAYGEFPKPGVESCGHDEIIGHIHTLAGLVFKEATAEGEPVRMQFDPSYYNKKTMSQFLKQQDVEEGDPLFDLCKVRTNQSVSQLTTEHFMTWEYFRPLREFIFDKFGEFVIEHSDDINKSRSSTRGECKWADDPDKQCKHHDQPKIHNWGMVRTADGFDTIWHRERTYAGWNYDQFNDYVFDTPEKISGTVLWSEVSRSLSNAIDEKQVVRYISKSLQRMLKRADNIVAKHGEGRDATFSWSDWSWLADLTSQIKGTNSKKRKENEIANGWIYTKVNSRMSFGHEIADFVWRPADEIFEYGVKVTGWKDSRYSWSSTEIAPMSGLRFASPEQAKAFIVAIRSAHLENGGFLTARSHTGLEKDLLSESNNGMSFSVVKYNMQDKYELAGVYHPEEYMHPAQLHMMYRNAAPAVIAPHDEKLTNSPTKGGPYRVIEVAPPEEEE